MRHGKQTGVKDLAESARLTDGPSRATREYLEGEELRALYHAMPHAGRISQTGTRRWRFYGNSAGGTTKRNPCADLVADARAAIATGATEAQVLAPFCRMLSIVRGAFRSAEGELPGALDLELAETREQGQADVAVRMFLAESPASPRRVALGAAAIQEVSEHLAALARLHDRLRQDRVLALHARPHLVPETGR